jgi:hypothetical protein
MEILKVAHYHSIARLWLRLGITETNLGHE